MIEFATDKTKPLVRQMWQTVFEDSNEYLDIYFSRKFKNENTLIYFEGEEATASLQMWEYDFSFYGSKIPIYYLAGLCTYKQHRRKGYMAQLIERAHQIMKERKIALTVLVPGEEWLFHYYEGYGYAHVFQKDSEIIPLEKIIQRNDTIDNAFAMFDRVYNRTDFTVLKNITQFKTIVEEQRLSNFEVKTNIDALARIIDVSLLLQLFAKKFPLKRFTIKITGDIHIRENNTFYTIEEGVVSKFPQAIADFEITNMELCELLMGQDKEEFEARISAKFPTHRPTINLMLE